MKHIRFFLLPVFFFLALFAFYRLAFVLLFARHEPAGEMLYAFVVGLRLDLAVCAYVMILPYLLWLLSFGKLASVFNGILKYYFIFVISVIHLQGIANLVIYRYWDSLLNWRALSYLDDPKEAMASVNLMQLVTWLAIVVLCIAVTSRFFLRKVFSSPAEKRTPWVRLGYGIFIPGLLLLAARGGWQLLPVNESVAYYSPSRQLNDAAVNSLWHLGHSARVASNPENLFRNMDDAQAKSIMDSLLRKPVDESPGILTVAKPNIVLLVLESYSADLLGCLGGSPSAAPFIDSLAGQGLLFSGIYSSGFRTDQGLTSLLSGFPATPLFSVIRYPEKTARLPSLVRTLKKIGYNSSYYYGGAGNFRNMKAYCFNLGFNVFRDEEDFDDSLPRSKWGVHDEYVLARQEAELAEAHQPFFSVVMTLSNHEPYDVPMPVHFPGSDDASKFRNSAYYTDRSLQQYFHDVSQEPWYENTLFILAADHGHTLPMNRPMPEPSSHHMPLIFFGPVLKKEFCGRRIDVTGNHHDLPATLLSQLHADAKPFEWSRNLLDSTAQSFAYYEQEDGFGWIEPGRWVYYSSLQNRIVLHSDTTAGQGEMVRKGSAYLQELFDDFLKY